MTARKIDSPIVYALSTRDRPERVVTCLRSLDDAHRSAFPGTKSLAYVLDDSTSPGFSNELQSHISQLDLPALWPHILTARSQEQFRATLVATHPSASELFRRLCSPPGTPGWNLANARNFLFLFLGWHHQPRQVVCLVDDDVICTTVEHYGKLLSPTVSQMFKRAVPLSRRFRHFAIGPRFLGCEDIPIARGLIKACRRLYTGATEPGFPSFTATSPSDLDATDPVPSGGLMLTTVQTLRLLPLMPFYNEDWIWGRLVSVTPDSYVARTRGFAVHAPPCTVEPSLDDVVFQEVGEALYQAVMDLTLVARTRNPVSSPELLLSSLTEAAFEYQLRRRVRVLRRWHSEITTVTPRTDSSLLLCTKRWWLDLLERTACLLAVTDPEKVVRSIRSLIPAMAFWKGLCSPRALQSLREVPLVPSGISLMEVAHGYQ